MVHDINLLPPARRQRLSQQVFLDAVTFFVYSLVSGLIVVSVIGAATGVVLHLLASTGSQSAAAELREATDHYRQLRDTIAEQNKMLADMESLAARRIAWSDYFADLLQALPPGTTVDRISGSVERRTVVISGQAVARSAVIVAEERLKLLPWVAAVQSPNSNLIQRVNPLVTFTLTLKSDEVATPP